MWQAPTDEQLADLRALLPTAVIGHELRQAIEFRAGLPLTPRPRPRWDHIDAVVLVALRRTGGLLHPWIGLSTLFGSLDMDGVPSFERLRRSLGRLHAAGLIAFQPRGRLRLTREGRRVAGPRRDEPALGPEAVVNRLNESEVPQEDWILHLDAYSAAADAYGAQSTREARRR